jgi:hypothetical protein
LVRVGESEIRIRQIALQKHWKSKSSGNSKGQPQGNTVNVICQVYFF